MADYVFLRGGPCIPECLPICEGCRETTWERHANDFPSRVAGEYNRGHFTLGWVFNPLSIGYEARALECRAIAPGDFVALYMVPELHTIHDVFLSIEPSQTVYASSSMPNRMSYPNNMVGMEISAKFELRDVAGALVSGATPPAVPTALAGVESPPKPATGADQIDLYRRAAVLPAEGGFFVPKGQFLVVGFTVDSLPTANPFGEGPFPMDMMSGQIAMVSHVTDYQHPING